MSDVRTVAQLKRLINTPSGNPRWHVRFTDGTAAYTKPDADVAYGIDNAERQGACTVVLDQSGLLVGLEPVQS